MALKKKMRAAKKDSEYPRIEQLGIPVNKDGVRCDWVTWDAIDKALNKYGLSRKVFGDLFGCQTMRLEGPYPWDVEDVLERMMSGKLQGTQFEMD
jgi:hypothetical protein